MSAYACICMHMHAYAYICVHKYAYVCMSMHVYAHAGILISDYHVFAYVCIRMAVNDCAYSSQVTCHPNEPLPHHLHPHRGGGGVNRPAGEPRRLVHINVYMHDIIFTTGCLLIAY